MSHVITSADNGKWLSFTLFPSAIIGSNFQHVKIMAVMDADTASGFIDVAAMHANVYPTLPTGYNLPGKQNTYQYVRVKLQDGQTTVLGIPWIDPATVVILENLKFVITVNDVTSSDLTRLRNSLVANGFNNIEISTVNLN